VSNTPLSLSLSLSFYLSLSAASAGYDGHFTNKQGKVREGSATFWRTSRFQRILTKDILLRDVFKQVCMCVWGGGGGGGGAELVWVCAGTRRRAHAACLLGSIHLFL